MKAISVRQPWANLIAHGIKTVETRTWRTFYRGSLLICAGQSIDKNSGSIIRCPSQYISKEPQGVGLAICRLDDCVEMKPHHENDACCPCFPGLFAWILSDVRPILPFPVRGQLGLFEVEMPEDRRSAHPEQLGLF